ncbi:MAG: class I SAM-dependent methyltransferase [Candidatus Nanopelagicales bacterium]
MDETARPAMYEAFADAFDAHAATSAFNALYDRPAVLEVVGDVAGLEVLDAGCGPGHYAEALVAAGASVTAFDASPRMVELTAGRVGDRADVRVADLEAPLAWLADHSFDVAVLALVIHHVEDRVAMLRELLRVLRPGGRLVVSTVHPTADWRRLGGSYFERGWVSEEWNAGWPVRFWRQPLTDWCEEFVDAGLRIDRIVEPQPDDAMRVIAPEVFGELSTAPAFIVFSLSKPDR